jgi:hypothetical protein
MFDDLTCINCTQKLIPRRFGLERFHCIHENDLNANNFSEIIRIQIETITGDKLESNTIYIM